MRRVSLHLPMQMHLLLSSGRGRRTSGSFQDGLLLLHFYTFFFSWRRYLVRGPTFREWTLVMNQAPAGSCDPTRRGRTPLGRRNHGDHRWAEARTTLHSVRISKKNRTADILQLRLLCLERMHIYFLQQQKGKERLNAEHMSGVTALPRVSLERSDTGHAVINLDF